jgi:hypothetical protein
VLQHEWGQRAFESRACEEEDLEDDGREDFVALLAAAQEMSDQKLIDASKGQSAELMKMIVPPTHAFEFVEPSAWGVGGTRIFLYSSKPTLPR